MEAVNARVLALSQCRTQIDRALVHGWYDAIAGNMDMAVAVRDERGFGDYSWYFMGRRAYYAACWDQQANESLDEQRWSRESALTMHRWYNQ